MSAAMRTRKKARHEEAEQARLVRWSHRSVVRAVIPALRFMHHSPNGGVRSGFVGAQMTALGCKPGFPDLILPALTADHCGLAIEMKTEVGRTTIAQEEWLAHFRANGWRAAVCRSAEDARLLICEYFGVDPAETDSL